MREISTEGILILIVLSTLHIVLSTVLRRLEKILLELRSLRQEVSRDRVNQDVNISDSMKT
jgi:hypothetical protein